MSDLCEGRVCVVTGAARGIGRAHVEALVAAGARVVVNDVDTAAVDDAVVADVTGRVIVASGKRLAVAEGWRRGPTGPPVADPEDVDAAIRPLLAAAAPNADVQGDIVPGLPA